MYTPVNLNDRSGSGVEFWTLESRLRILCCHVKLCFVTLHLFSSLSCMNEYLSGWMLPREVEMVFD